MIQLVCADSMQIMESLKMKFDMIFLDPPYFEWQSHEIPFTRLQKSFDKIGAKPDHNKLSALTLQLLKPNGCVFLCGTQPQMVRDWHYWSRFFKLNFEFAIVKHAGTPAISNKRPIPIHENIWCLWRKRDKLTELKLDVTKIAKRGKKVSVVTHKSRMQTRFGDEWRTWYKERGYPKSVIKVKRIDKNSKEYEGHPAQKPIKIMQLIIKISTDTNDWILDPFSGVGTTLMAAKELNRNCLGIEINKEYIRLTKRRFTRTKQMKKLERWIK